jgi:hypothetical protein
LWSEAVPDKSSRPYLINKTKGKNQVEGVTQMAECKVLSSIPSTEKIKKKSGVKCSLGLSGDVAPRSEVKRDPVYRLCWDPDLR